MDEKRKVTEFIFQEKIDHFKAAYCRTACLLGRLEKESVSLAWQPRIALSMHPATRWHTGSLPAARATSPSAMRIRPRPGVNWDGRRNEAWKRCAGMPDEVATLIRGLHPEIKAQVKSALQAIVRDPYCEKVLKLELDGLRSYRFKRYRVIYRLCSGEKCWKLSPSGLGKTFMRKLSGSSAGKNDEFIELLAK
jgi:mRNA interferase RelE/StbE